MANLLQTCAATCLCSPVVCSTTRANAPIVCGNTCVSGAVLCATTRAQSPIVCATSCGESPVLKVGGCMALCQTSGGIRFRRLTTGSDVGLQLSDYNDTWRVQLYGASGYYGFLDAAWGSWDIRKAVNGTLEAWVGSGGFIHAQEGGLKATTCVTAPVVCATSCVATACLVATSHNIQGLAGVAGYTWCACCLACSYSPSAVASSFVRAAQGWQNYGTVLHVGGRASVTPSDAGGDFQLYMGHGASYGGIHLQVRSANNDASPSDSWTTWKTLLDSCNISCGGAPIVCGTSCVISGNSWLQSTCIKGPIVCATACVKSPTLCATTKVNYGACATSYICSNGDYLKHENQYGYINIGPGNSSWAHISTDRNSFYFNTKLTVNSGCVASYDEDMQLVRIGSATQRLVVGPGTTTSCQQMCICGNLYVSGMVCTEGVEGDTFNSASCKLNSITCFNTSCVTGYDAIYDIYVSANPNCAGSGVYRDVVHMTSYVTTGYSGSAVTKYINTVEHFSRGDAHSSGAGSVTASVHLLVGTVGCECYAQGCNTCLQVRICGGSTATNAAARGSECVLIKRIL